MCNRCRPNRAAAIARFLAESRFQDQGAETVAILTRFPGASYADVVKARGLSLQILQARRPGADAQGDGLVETL